MLHVVPLITGNALIFVVFFAASQQQQKHDIFVGNLAFSTTEEQLHQAFSEIGRVLKVRMVTDLETGKPRGFAFIEFEDPQVALSAIRNMNDYELNGRRIRVNFSNSSHLEALAGRLGMDLSQQTQRSSGGGGGTSGSGGVSSSGGAGTQAVAESLKSMTKGEMYDVVAKLKEVADRDPDEARRLLSGHPQLPEAILHLMSKLDMIKTPVSTEGYAALNPAATLGLPPPPPPQAATAPRAADPRARIDPRVAAASTAVPRKDPRAAMDPRQQQAATASTTLPAMQAPPPPQFPVPPPSMQVPPPMPPQAGVANLDPALIQQVMSLTPQQIAQLPPDGQQSIFELRQQITGGR